MVNKEYMGSLKIRPIFSVIRNPEKTRITRIQGRPAKKNRGIYMQSRVKDDKTRIPSQVCLMRKDNHQKRKMAPFVRIWKFG